MRESIWNKGIVLVVIVFFLSSSTALGSNIAALTSPLPGVISHEAQAIGKHAGGYFGSMGNVKVSPGAGNDTNPRVTTNDRDDIVIVYEQEETEYVPPMMTTVPVVFSADEGDTWTQQFEFNSLEFQGSGLLLDPDIIYNPAQDLLWFDAVDPNAEMYNEEMYFIASDIANATDAIGYAVSASTDQYFEAACAHTNDYFLSFTTRTYWYPEHVLGLGWFTYPDYRYPPALGGYYSDDQSIIRTAPLYEIEADYNVNRWFLVAESEALEGGTQICIKSGTTDKALIDNGEKLTYLDKYGDPEAAPTEFLGLGTDPDVSGSNNNVAVVFIRDGNLFCCVSSCVATYMPEFHWRTTTVDTGGASTPAVYMYGNTIHVAYVKNGNLYYKVSEDEGATWGDVQQKNDVNATVVAQKGSVDICKLGIAFVDNRAVNTDVYFASTKGPTPKLTITGLAPKIMTIKNIGDAPAYNVNWSITGTVTEGFLFLGKTAFSGNVLGALEPGQEIIVGKTQFLFGLGSIEIVGAAWADNAPVVSEKLVGRLLFFLFLNYKELLNRVYETLGNDTQ